MGWMEQKYLSLSDKSTKETSLLLSELLDEFANILKDRYSLIEFEQDGKKIKCFRVKDNEYIQPCYMYGGINNEFHNLVIEYSESPEKMMQYDKDEGGQFFPEDFESKEKMFAAMLEEIES